MERQHFSSPNSAVVATQLGYAIGARTLTCRVCLFRLMLSAEPLSLGHSREQGHGSTADLALARQIERLLVWSQVHLRALHLFNMNRMQQMRR